MRLTTYHQYSKAHAKVWLSYWGKNNILFIILYYVNKLYAYLSHSHLLFFPIVDVYYIDILATM